jgi:TATA-box binding protein (TBP) (component of TFIID and TFIIIB)
MENDDNYDNTTLGDSNFKEPDPNKSKKRKKKIIKKRQFENQATLIFHFDNGRYVNIKVFHNGKIQMTGVRSKEEAHMIIGRLIEIIKETKVTVVDWDEVRSNPNWTSKNQYIYTKIKTDKGYENLVKRLIMVDDVPTWVDHPDDKISKYPVNTPVIPDQNKIQMMNFETVMINSNYSIGFNIDRTKLHLLLKRKYNIYATLEATYQAVKSYYFFDSNNQDNNGVCKCEVPCFVIKEQQKGGTPTCSQVTIAVFRTGSVIITGGCTLEQTAVAYNFINKVIVDNYKIIYQKNEDDMIKALPGTTNTEDPISKLKQLMIERANENRRRAKKKSEVKKEKDTEPKVKGKRGRKPKILVEASQIIDYPVS